MKTKIIIFISLISLLFAEACKKIDETIFGDASISGYVYLKDSSNNGFPLPLKSQRVFLGTELSDVHSFLYSTTTDSLGYFKFEFLASNNYKVFSQVTVNNLQYSGNVSQDVTGNSVHQVQLDLFPSGYNNRLLLNFTDSLNNSVGNFQFHIYNNRLAALVDDATLAYFPSTITSSNGTYSKEDIYPNKYYIVAKKDFAGVQYSSFDSIEIGNTGEYYLSIRLSSVTVISNQLVVSLDDSFGGALSNFPIHLYLSRVAAINDQTNLAFVNSSTNNNGKFTIQNIAPNWYYVVSRDTLGGIFATAFDSIQVNNTGIFLKTVYVQ